jgi:hypothetical protein
VAKFATGQLQLLRQSLHSSSGSIEALARIDFLNLDDTPLPSAYGIDGMYTKPPIANEPLH